MPFPFDLTTSQWLSACVLCRAVGIYFRRGWGKFLLKGRGMRNPTPVGIGSIRFIGLTDADTLYKKIKYKFAIPLKMFYGNSCNGNRNHTAIKMHVRKVRT